MHIRSTSYQVASSKDPITTMKELVVDLQKYDKLAHQSLRAKVAEVCFLGSKSLIRRNGGVFVCQLASLRPARTIPVSP
eukprot:9501086-Pyramimonas_sp.AAC.4